MTSYTYLAVNFFTIIICFIYSFDKRLEFYRFFAPFLKSAIIVGIPFILWDVYFTKVGVWWFNSTYTVGFRIAGLPIEEWLFFLCIPFSCTFTYFCITRFKDVSWANGFGTIISFLTIIVCSVIALLHYDKLYTLVTAVVTVLSVIYFQFIAKINWIGQASLLFTILLLGFLPVNGVLTGTGLDNPIVNYNPTEFLGIRIGTIPIEDAVYGYTQFLWIIYFFKKSLSDEQRIKMKEPIIWKRR